MTESVHTGGGNGPEGASEPRGMAVLSSDGLYRYSLWRVWDRSRPAVLFVMLNPSTADAREDDPTIRRCIRFARDWGHGSLLVGNLFGLRSTDPAALARHPDPVGPANDSALRELAEAADRVVVAWGSKGTLRARSLLVADQLAGPRNLWALGVTADGQPRHPLYVRKDAELVRWAHP